MNKNLLFSSIVSGLLLGLSWPTYGFVFLIFIGFVPLLHVEYELRKKSTFKIFYLSFIAFLIWNLITSWWLINSTIFGMVFAVLLYSTLMSTVFISFSVIEFIDYWGLPSKKKNPFSHETKRGFILRTHTYGLTVRLLVWSKTNAMNWLIFTAFYLLTV